MKDSHQPVTQTEFAGAMVAIKLDFDRFDERFNEIDQRLDQITAEMATKTEVAELRQTTNRLEQKTDRLERSTERILDLITDINQQLKVLPVLVDDVQRLKKVIF